MAIVDYDVHHGNGTQRIFYDDPRCSTSRRTSIRSIRAPAPPTRSAGDGRGFTVNLPLEAGATDADYERVYREIVAPVLRQFDPELILVSAGFDAHADDPLGGMRLTAGAVRAALTTRSSRCRRVLQRAARGVTEGGYDLAALRGSSRGVAATRSRRRPRRGAPTPPSGDRPRRARTAGYAVAARH